MPFLVLVAIAVGVIASLKPWQALQKQRKDAGHAKQEMKQAERKHAELLRERTQKDSPIGREEMAREQGFTKPGERPLEIDP